jgi:hypothetical protein
MTRRVLIAVLTGAATLAAAPAAPATSVAATVDVMVVGKAGVLRGPRAVALRQREVKVGRRRCAVGRGTPLSVLAGTGLDLKIRDSGACGGRPRDAGGLYVFQVGAEREQGSGGWVYKVGNRAGTTGAGDPSGPFGSGGLRAGQRLLWFWCRQAGGCQRTLDAVPDRAHARAGERLRVTVRGYDDAGAGVRVVGATVRLGAATATTGADGTATLTVPSGSKRLRLQAERAGMVRAFPRKVTVA